MEVFTPLWNQEYTMIRSPGHIEMKKKEKAYKLTSIINKISGTH